LKQRRKSNPNTWTSCYWTCVCVVTFQLPTSYRTLYSLQHTWQKILTTMKTKLQSSGIWCQSRQK